MKLDEPMRERLRRLASTEHGELDEAARTRIALAARRALPARHARTVQVGLVLAAAFILAVLLWPATLEQQRTAQPSRPAGPVAGPQAPVVASAQHAACGPVVTASWRANGMTGGSELDLGARALFRAEAKAVVRTLSLESCSTKVVLEQGALFVHARELGGGALSVETPLGLVEVKGTRFGVRASAHELRVSVDEGKVRVTPRAGESVLLVAGQALRLGTKQLAKVSKLSARLRAEVVPAEIEIEDEKVWHEGTVRPSQLPFEPGSNLTEEGRPMRKPRVVNEGVAP